MSMKQVRAQFLAVGAIAVTLLAAGCGGGGSDAPPPPVAGPPPPPASVTISGKAVDGALQGAIACYDSNNNNACDAGEPASGTSDAAGNFSLSVLASVAGQHRVIVNVPATAIDADTGQAVGTAFTMVAPASGTSGAQNAFVSPLTTLVARQMDTTAQARADAAAFVQSQLGLAVSPLADFTAASTPANTTAANAARLVIKTQNQAATAVAPAIGQTDLSGGMVPRADVDKAVARVVAGALPVIGASAADPALAGLTGTALQTALNTAATTVVASTGLTVASVVVAIGIARLPPDTTAGTPELGAALAALQYTDANNWFMRANQATALDNTPDANGLRRFYDVRTRMQPYAHQPTVGVAESFAQGNSKDRAGDLHWNGTAWIACTLGMRNTQTQRDAQGRSIYNACDGRFRGVTTRATLDIAGQSMATVVTDRIVPVVGPNTYTGGGGGNGWSLNTAALGTASFPAGSQLFAQTDIGTESAAQYDARALNQAAVFSQAVADGGDARTGTVACQNAGTAVATVSLGELAARSPGRACIFNAQTNADGTSINPSEAWGLSTVSMGDVPNYFATLPAGTGNYYSNAGRMRVAFTGAGNATTYYLCHVRRIDNSTRNCTAIGAGTYTIAQLGDARVMSFNNLPAAIQRLTFTRLFVERGGRVYFGFKIPVGIETVNVRLNLVAANAMLSQLGMPPIRPADAPQALTGAKAANAALLNGLWGMHAADGSTALLRFGANGRYLHAQAPTADASGRPGLELGWADFDLAATNQAGLLLEIDSNNQFGLSHLLPNDRITSITASAITSSDGTVISRFADSGTGLVGVWSTDPSNWNAATFAFFPNGRVLSIHPYAGDCATARQGPPGVEHAPYSFNAGNGALAIGPRTVDSSGCTGLWDIGAAAGAIFNSTVTIAADGRSAVFTLPEGGTMTLYRVAVQ